MQLNVDFTAWSALLIGLFSIFAGIGALRRRGLWQTMIGEIANSPALQLLAGLAELVVGALVYLANPWLPADILSCVMRAIGGLMMVEALVVLGFCDIYMQFWIKVLSHLQRSWAIMSILIGLTLAVPAAARFH